MHLISESQNIQSKTIRIEKNKWKKYMIIVGDIIIPLSVIYRKADIKEKSIKALNNIVNKNYIIL